MPSKKEDEKIGRKEDNDGNDDDDEKEVMQISLFILYLFAHAFFCCHFYLHRLEINSSHHIREADLHGIISLML